LHAPSSGTVQKRNAVAGKYFQEGEMLLEISDLNSLWVEMDVYEPDVSLVKVGQEVTLHFTSLPGERYLGAIEFINAIMDPNSRTLKIRTTINNSDKRLRPGMTGEGHVFVEIPNSRLVVPRTAILDNGKSKVVWTKVAPEQFQAKLVETGLEAEGYVEIKAGLMEGEEVVIEGNFLLDSQAQLFGGYEMRSDSPASQVPHHD
jgi:RND family efflux transporter MFP subunit